MTMQGSATAVRNRRAGRAAAPGSSILRAAHPARPVLGWVDISRRRPPAKAETGGRVARRRSRSCRERGPGRSADQVHRTSRTRRLAVVRVDCPRSPRVAISRYAPHRVAFNRAGIGWTVPLGVSRRQGSIRASGSVRTVYGVTGIAKTFNEVNGLFPSGDRTPNRSGTNSS